MFVGTAGKATWRVHFPGRSPHDINAAFRDKGQSSVFLPCLFPRHHPHKDKVSGAFFNLLYFNWWEKVVPLIGALSWMDLIRSNDQINGEFWIRTFGDWVVWRGLCCYISLHLSLWWEEKQSANGSQTWMLLHGRGRREDLGSSVGPQQRRYSEQKTRECTLVSIESLKSTDWVPLRLLDPPSQVTCFSDVCLPMTLTSLSHFQKATG